MNLDGDTVALERPLEGRNQRARKHVKKYVMCRATDPKLRVEITHEVMVFHTSINTSLPHHVREGKIRRQIAALNALITEALHVYDQQKRRRKPVPKTAYANRKGNRRRRPRVA